MTSRIPSFLRRMSIACIALGSFMPAGLADQEAGNFAHVAAGPSGRCYAKSVPRHVFDPQGEIRQQGRTQVYRVTDRRDVLVSQYDWFSQRLFLECGSADGITVVRVGPWQRGHVLEPEHLALAFYRDGKLLKRYSTLEIAGSGPASNVAASVSHYSVFASWPDLVSATTSSGPVFTESWTIRATTIDGRSLVFDLATGELLP